MTKLSQEEIDWLVEGELSANQREELISRMDSDPSTWKRCAIAFMEQQALVRTLKSLDLDDRVPESVARFNSNTELKLAKGSWKAWHWVLAGVLAGVMFLAGYSLRQAPAVDTMADVELAPKANEVQPVDRQIELALTQTVQRLNLGNGKVIALLATGQKEGAQFIPILESEVLIERLRSLPPFQVPQKLAKNLVNSGYQLQPNRQFLSVDNGDGTNEVIPLNVLDCQFVGKSIF